jgi:uncharacterized damage-inducible protein DinB
VVKAAARVPWRSRDDEVTTSQPEAWLRGPVADVPTALQPVAHALLQAFEEVEQAIGDLGTEDLWTRPGGAASIAFHLRHMAGSLDRLFTYASGEALSDAQRMSLRTEAEHTPGAGASELLRDLRESIERALAQLQATPPARLDDARGVGRAKLPSTVRGLLHHGGEHCARHAGQVVTTARIVRGLREPHEVRG